MSDKLRTNFLDPETEGGFEVAIWWWSMRTENFRIWMFFYLRKWWLKELSTAVKMWCWSDWLNVLWKKISKALICLPSETFLERYSCILSLNTALLTRGPTSEEQWLWYGAFNMRPLGTILRDLHFIRKVRWFKVLTSWIFIRSSFLKLGYMPGWYWLCK
jgi:hypothetical protein